MNEKILKNFFYFSLFILLFVGPLILFKPAYDYTLIKNVAGYLFCLFLSIYFIFKNKEFTFSPLSIYPFLLFSVWILIRSFTAPFKYGASKSLEIFLLYMMIFLLSLNTEIEKRWIYFWIFSGLIAEMIGIFQYLSPKHYPISTFGNPNFFAGHFLMVIFISLALLFQKKFIKGEKEFLIFFLITGTYSLLITKSRAAIFAYLASLSLFNFLKFRERKGIVKWLGFILFSLLLISLSPTIKKWINTNIRIYIWKGTWGLISSRIITGWGFGNFIFFYPYYRVREYFLKPESTPVTDHAHCEYLEIWAETGIIGLILFLVFIFSILYQSKNFKEKQKSFLFSLCPGIICGIVAVLSDNIFSTNLRNPSTSMFFWFLLGIAGGNFSKKKYISSHSKLLWLTISIVSFIMVVFTSFYRILPEIYLKKGIIAKNIGKEMKKASLILRKKGRIKESKEYMEEASRYFREAEKFYKMGCKINPFNYVLHYKLAYVYGELNEFRKALKIYIYINKYLFPHFAKTDANLGTVYLALGDYKKAIYYYRWAEWFNPYDKDVLCSMASIYIIFYHRIDKAKQYLKRVLTIDPKNRYANRTLKLLGEKPGG